MLTFIMMMIVAISVETLTKMLTILPWWWLFDFHDGDVNKNNADDDFGHDDY
jgi:hypothetical protein